LGYVLENAGSVNDGSDATSLLLASLCGRTVIRREWYAGDSTIFKLTSLNVTANTKINYEAEKSAYGSRVLI
jgi:hypothetical protein